MKSVLVGAAIAAPLFAVGKSGTNMEHVHYKILQYNHDNFPSLKSIKFDV